MITMITMMLTTMMITAMMMVIKEDSKIRSYYQDVFLLEVLVHKAGHLVISIVSN